MATQKITYTDYMRVSHRRAMQTVDYMKARGPHNFNNKALVIIDHFDNKAVTDETFRAEAFKYFSGTPEYSTIKLRELCRQVGFDYWADLNTSNAIDVLDTVSANNRPEQTNSNE